MGTQKTTRFVIFAIVLVSIVIFSCNKTELSPLKQQGQTSSAKYDTVTSLAQMGIEPVIWKHNGEFILVTHENSTDEENEELENEDGENEARENSSTASGCSDVFAGSARKAAKTSYATAAYMSYSSISSLRASLQTDTYMHTLGITTSSPRVAVEKRDVSVTTAYLYAISRESDNDFHMIIGDASHTAGSLMNCECGGLPSSTSAASYNTMKAVRNYIKSYFGTDFCGKSGYTKFSTPIKITVLKGSLFYDIDHSPGTIGPTGLRANTSWEMHPISAITF
jgi:hypothetical protein